MSFSPYAEYRTAKSERLSRIPTHWIEAPLKRATTLSYGESLPDEKREDGDVPVYGSNGEVGRHSRPNTSEPVIIIGRKGSFGAVNFSQCPVFAIDTTYFVDASCSPHDIRWLYYLLSVAGLSEVSQDTGVPGLSREAAYSRSVAIPPSPEQRAIADFLDREVAKIDALITKQLEFSKAVQVDLRDAVGRLIAFGTKGTGETSSTDSIWHPLYPKHWSLTRLKHLTRSGRASIKAGPFGSDLKVSDFQSSGVRVLNQKTVITGDFWAGDECVSDSKAKELSGFRVEPGDILITSRGTIGRAARVPELDFEAIIHPCLIRVRLDEKIIHPEFAMFWLEFSTFLEQSILASNATTIEVIYSNNLANAEICLPSLGEQLEILAASKMLIADADAARKNVDGILNLLRERRSAIITAAVTGQIEVATKIAAEAAA